MAFDDLEQPIRTFIEKMDFMEPTGKYKVLCGYIAGVPRVRARPGVQQKDSSRCLLSSSRTS